MFQIGILAGKFGWDQVCFVKRSVRRYQGCSKETGRARYGWLNIFNGIISGGDVLIVLDPDNLHFVFTASVGLVHLHSAGAAFIFCPGIQVE